MNYWGMTGKGSHSIVKMTSIKLPLSDNDESIDLNHLSSESEDEEKSLFNNSNSVDQWGRFKQN